MAKVEIPEYPDNSFDKKQKSTELVVNEEKPIKKLKKGEAIRQKKGLGKKFSETFLANDAESVGKYLFKQVLVPAGKETLSECVTRGLDMFLYEDTRARVKPRGGYGRSYREEEHYSYDQRYKSGDSGRPRIASSDRKTLHFDNILFRTESGVKKAINSLYDLLEAKKVVTVADLYEIIGDEDSWDYTDTKYGWYSLEGIDYRRTRDREYWKLIMPRAEYIPSE